MEEALEAPAEPALKKRKLSRKAQIRELARKRKERYRDAQDPDYEDGPAEPAETEEECDEDEQVGERAKKNESALRQRRCRQSKRRGKGRPQPRWRARELADCAPVVADIH